MTTKLDDASWETLPSEMRKVNLLGYIAELLTYAFTFTVQRDISYSAILLRPLPKLPELHAAVCSSIQLLGASYQSYAGGSRGDTKPVVRR